MGTETSASLKTLSPITLFVEDLASAKSFYQDVLGLEVVYEDENSAAFDFGAQSLSASEAA